MHCLSLSFSRSARDSPTKRSELSRARVGIRAGRHDLLKGRKRALAAALELGLEELDLLRLLLGELKEAAPLDDGAHAFPLRLAVGAAALGLRFQNNKTQFSAQKNRND